MPTLQPVVDTLIPKVEEKPIPTRIVTTRTLVKPANPDQPSTSRSEPAADSATPADSVKLSPQLSALARKEQAFRQKEQALKVREKELETKLSEADQYSQLKNKIGSKDYSEAERLGLNYEGYTQYLLDKQAGEDPVQKALQEANARIQALEKGKEDHATQEYEETVAEYKREIDRVVATSSDYPRTKKSKSEAAVLQLILDSWEKDNLEMTVEEASKDVEAYLTALSQDLQVDPPREERRLPPPKAGSRTLTQNMAAVGTETVPFKSLHHLSEAERYAEARRRVLARREKGI